MPDRYVERLRTKPLPALVDELEAVGIAAGYMHACARTNTDPTLTEAYVRVEKTIAEHLTQIRLAIAGRLDETRRTPA